MEDRPNAQVRFQIAKGGFDPRQQHVRLPQVVGWQVGAVVRNRYTPCRSRSSCRAAGVLLHEQLLAGRRVLQLEGEDAAQVVGAAHRFLGLAPG